jgi:hypothetical protein
MLGVLDALMANTITRPTIGTSTGLVTYVDANGNLFPAVVTNDFGAGVVAPTAGCVDLAYIDLLNPLDTFPPIDFTQPTRGRKVIFANIVVDQGNIPNSLTVNTATTSASGTATVSSATGVPAAGFVNGPGIAFNQPYTLSGTTVTLTAGTASVTQAAAPLTYSAAAIATPYWRYPTAYTI